MRTLHFTLLLLIALATGCNRAPRRDYLFALRSTDGLKRNADITFLGIRVGYVGDLRLSSDGKSVIGTGHITDPHMRLLQGDSARIILPGLLADLQVEITRSSLPGGELPVGSTISVSPLPTRTLSPEQQGQLEELIGSALGHVTNGAPQSTNSK
jgi:ABC-type transporter Mla subunit MlaD